MNGYFSEPSLQPWYKMNEHTLDMIGNTGVEKLRSPISWAWAQTAWSRFASRTLNELVAYPVYTLQYVPFLLTNMPSQLGLILIRLHLLRRALSRSRRNEHLASE